MFAWCLKLQAEDNLERREGILHVGFEKLETVKGLNYTGRELFLKEKLKSNREFCLYKILY